MARPIVIFRPARTRLWRVFLAAALVVIAVLGVVNGEGPGAATIVAPIGALFVLVSLRERVEVTPSEVRIVGSFGLTVVPRTDVVRVIRGPFWFADSGLGLVDGRTVRLSALYRLTLFRRIAPPRLETLRELARALDVPLHDA